MSVDLLVIVPSRGRPNHAKELIQDFRATQTGRARLLFVLDANDSRLEDYLEIRDFIVRGRLGDVWFDVVPRLSLSDSLNAVVLRNRQFYSYVVLCGDDVKLTTVGWDKLICDAEIVEWATLIAAHEEMSI